MNNVGGALNDSAAIAQLVADIIAQESQPGGVLDQSAGPSTFNVMDLKAPIESYLFARRNPVAAYAVPAIVLFLVFIIGRSIGERRGR